MLIYCYNNEPLVSQIDMKSLIFTKMLYQNGEVAYGFFNLAFLVSYISLFSYWSVLALTKYQDEPIATSTEFRIGDDNLGNFTSPVISFCRHRHLNEYMKNCKDKSWKALQREKGEMEAMMKCMQNYADIDEFLKEFKTLELVKCK